MMSGSGSSVMNSIFSCFSPNSPPPSHANANAAEGSPPKEFLCPISASLMADPVVVVPTGHSFDRACIEACKELGYSPPLLRSSASPSADHLGSLSLIPNLALKEAILNWCDLVACPSAVPISQGDARSLVRRLMMGGKDAGGDQEPSPNDEPQEEEEEEERILMELQSPKISVQGSALGALFRRAKAGAGGAVSLCTPRIMAAIIPMLRPDHSPLLQVNAGKAILAFSQTQTNRIKIVGCGAVPPLLDVLANGVTVGSRVDAVSTICNLAEDEMGRMVMGHLGAIPALLETFCDSSLVHTARREAATALCHLTLCPDNLKILADMKTVPLLLEMATDESSNEATVLRAYAVRLLINLGGETESREDVINGGGLELMLRLVREDRGMDDDCLAVLYRICVGSPSRFRTLAMSAGAETVLAADKEKWGEDCREMAKVMLNDLRESHSAGLTKKASRKGKEPQM